MSGPPDIVEQLKLVILARREIERLTAEAEKYRTAGRIQEADESLRQAKELEAQVKALSARK